MSSTASSLPLSNEDPEPSTSLAHWFENYVPTALNSGVTSLGFTSLPEKSSTMNADGRCEDVLLALGMVDLSVPVTTVVTYCNASDIDSKRTRKFSFALSVIDGVEAKLLLKLLEERGTA
ncbi:hypothetical protein CY34DRAFT_16852 [Suillus luteus UH-Slu-Lm8-n1]|uniref:Uncharacterized protein n=1 Tax=Suillus luteus UH-Slu-Lm8-n1 TaxID=930992 RepID=A0A0D0AC93_9AGAM|nr:hypothetical protein CY34DRAFT_16852 [Suillus luteus UH-Slu-Lm8-n1]